MIMNSSTKEERKNLAISKNGDLNWTVTEREEGFIAQSKTSKYEEITFVPGYVLLSDHSRVLNRDMVLMIKTPL